MNFKFISLCLSGLLICGCDNAASETPKSAAHSNDAELADFVKKVKSELVFVEGGKFQMGDFGAEHYEEHMQLDINQDSKPLHEVELTSYSISKYKTRNADYQFYLKHENLPMRKAQNELLQSDWDALNKQADMPAHADWNEADKYCTWLANVTDLPFALATEAQWEYAARSRGQYRVVATDDGTWKAEKGKGINFATDQDRAAWAEKYDSGLSSLFSVQVGQYPPNPLGVFDMASNGYEWVKDWYSPDYYQHSPLKDPQGPEQPVFKNASGKMTKAMRSTNSSGPGRGISIVRAKASPDNNGELPIGNTIRCVVNRPSPVK